MSARILEALVKKREIEGEALFREAERQALVSQGREAEAKLIQSKADTAITLIQRQRFPFKEIEPIIEFLEALGHQTSPLVASAIANEEKFAPLRPMIKHLLPFVIFPEPKEA